MMKKSYYLNFIVFLIFLTPSLYGQEKVKVRKDTTKQWEFGLDLLWLIDKNQVPPINVQVKKKLTANSWLRLRTGVKYNSNDSSYNSLGWPGPPYESRNFIGFMRVGWESESKINNKISFYKGIDLGFWYQTDIVNRTRYWFEVDTYLRYKESKNTFIYEVLPLVGIKYHLSDVFSISLESSIRCSYQRDKYSLDGYELPPGIPGGVATGNYENINNKNLIEMIPIQFLNLNIKVK